MASEAPVYNYQEDAVWMVSGSFAWMIFWASCHMALRALTPAAPKDSPPESRNVWSNWVVSSIHAVFSAAAAIYALLYEAPFNTIAFEVLKYAGEVDTLHGESPTLLLFLPMTLGYFAYDLTLMFSDRALLAKLMVMHHTFSTIVFPVSAITRCGSMYVLFYLFAETTTPVVNKTLYFLPRNNVQGPKYAVTALSMIIAFFFVRVYPSISLVYSLHTSWAYWETTHIVISTTARLMIPIPAMLFSYWWSLMLKGVVSFVMPSGEKSEKSD